MVGTVAQGQETRWLGTRGPFCTYASLCKDCNELKGEVEVVARPHPMPHRHEQQGDEVGERFVSRPLQTLEHIPAVHCSVENMHFKMHWDTADCFRYNYNTTRNMLYMHAY